MCSCGLQNDFQLISHFRLQLQLHGAFPAWRPRCDSPVASGPFGLLGETVGVQSVSHDARTLINEG